MERDFTLHIYLKLINSLRSSGFSFQTFNEFLINPKPKVVILRHDVDKKPGNSLAFSKLQFELGIKGVYYFRAKKCSWNETIIKDIASMGHEIGYHYENMATAKGNIEKAKDDFEMNLAQLRKIVKVSTICMHGSPLSKYDSNISNISVIFLKESRAEKVELLVHSNNSQFIAKCYSSVFENTDIHIHVPAGAVPKDGPSAGVTIATSLVSAFTSIPVRRDVAMTGEITLRGNVLAIGGLKEKLLAAKRGIISTVMIPQNNEKNLSEVPDEILKGLEVNPVKSIEEVLKVALEQLPTSVIDPVDETAETAESESQEVTIIPQTDIPESPRTYDA